MNENANKETKLHQRVMATHIKEAKQFQNWQEKYFSGQYSKPWNVKNEWLEWRAISSLVGAFCGN